MSQNPTSNPLCPISGATFETPTSSPSTWRWPESPALRGESRSSLTDSTFVIWKSKTLPRSSPLFSSAFVLSAGITPSSPLLLIRNFSLLLLLCALCVCVCVFSCARSFYSPVAKDCKRKKNFYTEIFNWHNTMGYISVNYSLVRTDFDTDEID